MTPVPSLHNIEQMQERLVDIREKYRLESKKITDYYNTKYYIDLDRCATRLRISSTILTQSFSKQNKSEF